MRHSRGGRLLAIILASILTFNCNGVTAFADHTQTSTEAAQAQETVGETDLLTQQEQDAAAEEAKGVSSDTAEQGTDQAEAVSTEEETDEADAGKTQEVSKEDSQESASVSDGADSESAKEDTPAQGTALPEEEEKGAQQEKEDPAAKQPREKKAAPRKALLGAGNYNINSLVSEVVCDPAPESTDSVTGNAVINPENEYKMILTFEENGASKQFPDGNMTYTIPAGFTPTAQTGVFDLPLTGMTIEGNRFTVNEDGTVDITWNIPFDDPDDERTKAWISTTDAEFEVEFSGRFSEDAGQFDFGGDGNVYQNYETAKYSLQKTGSYDAATNKASYTITVKGTSGINQNIELTDEVTGKKAIVIDPSTISVEPAGKAVVSGAGAEGFGITIAELAKDETVTISYSADVDLDKITGTGNWDEAVNSVSGKDSQGMDVKSESNLQGQIKWTSMSKTAGKPVDQGDGTVLTEWTVTLNEDMNNALGGRTVTDSMSSDAPTTVKGDVTVTITSKSGATRTETISADGMDGWSYAVTDTEPCSYVFTYQTVSDNSALLNDTALSNTANLSK